MAKLQIPVMVSGLEMMRKVIGELSIEYEPGMSASKDFVDGFMCCRRCILYALDEMMKADEQTLNI